MEEVNRTVQGLGVSDGIAIGRAVCVQNRVGEVYRFPLREDRLDAEVERLHEAVIHTEKQLRQIRGQSEANMEEEFERIFEAHILMLKDRFFLDRVIQRIRDEHVNAEWAVHRTTEELAEKFQRIDNEYLRDRNQDILDVGDYLLRILQGFSHHELSELEEDVIIIADDLPPSEAVRLGRERVVGFAIESGSRTSHTTIIARSLNVPAVTGLAGITGLVTDEDPVIVDGLEGKVILHPTMETLDFYRRRQQEIRQQEKILLATRKLAASTIDGTRIHLMANIDLPEEIDQARRFGSDGIGLYRSEFLYIEKSPEMPTEDEHVAIYRHLLETAAPHPAIVRTYDLGGRKLAREVMDTREENPVLGLRGIRLTMARPNIFRTQLRALFRASVFGDLWIMLPLVSTLEEVHRFRAFAAEVFEELERSGTRCRREAKLGIMIEVPSAAMIADLLAREVDFFSIGTNDLIQYSLAVDRNNEHIADLYQPLHPAILRMLRFVIDSARKAEIEVSVCGEMAGDPRIAPLLIGLGMRRLSMSPRVIPLVKTRLRALSGEELKTLAQECHQFGTAQDVSRHLDQFLSRSLPT